jgi:two-component system, OmpR family, KDP operon response regulator KdpE
VTDAMFRVLVVEDDPDIRAVLRTLLESAGFRVTLAETAERGVIEARANRPDAILVDLGLPDRDGQHLIVEIRAFAAVPILVLSARSAETEKIAALDNGADDYVTKPFNAGEMMARLRAALRRSVRDSRHPEPLSVGRLTIDLERREARDASGPVHFTPLEFRLLECLVRNAGLVVTQGRLISEVWGPGRLDDTRRLRSYIKMLRQKIEPEPARPRLLVTEVGVGYRLNTSGAGGGEFLIREPA